VLAVLWGGIGAEGHYFGEREKSGGEILWTALGDDEGFHESFRGHRDHHHRDDGFGAGVLERNTKLRLNEGRLPFGEFNSKGKVRLWLPLSNGKLFEFELHKSYVMPASLQSKFPSIVTYSGFNVDGNRSSLVANVDFSPMKGLRAVIRDHLVEKDHWIDPINRDEQTYRAYSLKSRNSVTKSAWSCGSHPRTKKVIARKLAEEKANNTGKIFRHANEYFFIMALVANGEYSKFHGNTVQSVLAELVTLLNRINGIYKRELGVSFQLHENSERLICVHPCNSLSNNDWILDETAEFIWETGGISSRTYDIGHSLTTGSGGLACLGVLCNDAYKWCGTTGLPEPATDAFYVDYVSHEIAHQLGGTHTFSDCSGLNGNVAEDSAVEPGSGSTILGYAGICGSTDLQKHSDAYFHSFNIEQMLNYIGQVTSSGGHCGLEVRRNDPELAPKIRIDSTCVVPVNTAFQLNFDMVDNSPETRYSIEAINSFSEGHSFKDPFVARFRSWTPTTKPYRTFPNMYHLLYGVSSFVEVLPARNQSMNFRATVRDSLAPQRSSSDEDYDSIGFGKITFKDLRVDFVEDLESMSLRRLSVERVVAGSKELLTWNVGNSTSSVELLMAENTMEFFQEEIVDYVRDVKNLEWISLTGGLAINNTGSFEARIPFLDQEVSRNASVHFMIRSRENSECFHFDLMPFVELHDLRGLTQAPTLPPDGERETSLNRITNSSSKTAATSLLILSLSMILVTSSRLE